MKRRWLLFAVPAVVALALAAGTALAAFQERDVINSINDTVGVLRYLHGQVREVQEKLDMVKNTRLLTEKQHAAQQQIVQEEQGKDKPSAVKLEVFKISLQQLERQTTILRQTNLEKTYSERIKEIEKTIDRYRIQLDAKLLEFQVHFGKAPNVNLDFHAEISRFRKRELGVAYLTIR